LLQCCRALQIVANWEQSGNGLGQRETGDDECGHFDDANKHSDGDNRASFIQPQMGHKSHHLHLWHLSDKMGILNDVLNALSPEVAADSDNVRTDAAQVQNKRKRPGEEDEAEKKHKKNFRDNVGTSLACIALNDKMKELRLDEEKLDRCELALMDMDDGDDIRKEAFCRGRINWLQERVHLHHQDITRMRKEIGLPAADGNEDDEEEQNAEKKSRCGQQEEHNC